LDDDDGTPISRLCGNRLRCLDIRPGDGPAGVFLERVIRYRGKAPGDDWDGTSHLDTKWPVSTPLSAVCILPARMCMVECAKGGYRPRRPHETVFYRLVSETIILAEPASGLG
jgi:hypothetical protein